MRVRLSSILDTRYARIREFISLFGWFILSFASLAKSHSTFSLRSARRQSGVMHIRPKAAAKEKFTWKLFLSRTALIIQLTPRVFEFLPSNLQKKKIARRLESLNNSRQISCTNYPHKEFNNNLIEGAKSMRERQGPKE